MSPKFLLLALTASLCTGSIAFGDESGSTYRHRPQVQQQQQQDPSEDYEDYDSQDYQQQQQGGYYQQQQVQGCCAVQARPPAIMPYNGPQLYGQPGLVGPGYGAALPQNMCSMVSNGVGWTIYRGGMIVASGRAWQRGQVQVIRMRMIQTGCVFVN